VPELFDEEHASHYDQSWVRLAPLQLALYHLTRELFSAFPGDARVLCVGAGTGRELLFLAEQFPGWRFTVVEPSAPMLKICRHKATHLQQRCKFHQGYLDSLPDTEPFAAATTILVSHFVETPQKLPFYKEVARRLQPGGRLVSADLMDYPELLDPWFQLMSQGALPPEKLQEQRRYFAQSVHRLDEVAMKSLLQKSGFVEPRLFYKACLIGGWVAERAEE